MYTIYFDPVDYPGRYVVRRFLVRGGDPAPDPAPLVVTRTLKQARRSLPDGLYCLGRERGDEPQIVETWV